MPVSPRLGELKLRAIDVALSHFDCRRLADLGAVWAVDAGYAFYALDRYGLERVVVCDDEFTDPVLRRASRVPNVRLVRGNFGSRQVAEQIGSVDTVLLFDVLLHQVKPDWNAILDLYAPQTRCLVLAGPWWNGSETVRLLELGRDAYLDSVPLRDFHESVLNKLDELNEDRGKPWRDCHDIWQWGITDGDLRAHLSRLGFKLAYHENVGRWHDLERFDDCSYVFVRQDEL